jgi:thymidine kinase
MAEQNLISKSRRQPEFIVFTGPMFGSKTTKLLAVVDRFRYQKRDVVAFKPRMDDRYSEIEIVTHSGGKMTAIGVNTGDDVLHALSDFDRLPDVIAVDEAFMIDGIASTLIQLYRKGVTIIVSSLQLSASGRAFEEIRDMMPYATKIEICPAVCTVSGEDAYYTHRKLDAANEITVGGEELYEPRSWKYHSFFNVEE